MNILSVMKNYSVWHYSTAYVDFVHIWWNYFWFINHLFSVPDVFLSLFAPFKRLQEAKPNLLLHPEEFFSSLIVNLIMRIVGFFLRAIILMIALLCFLTVLIGGLLFVITWTILPILVVEFFLSGILLLVS